MATDPKISILNAAVRWLSTRPSHQLLLAGGLIAAVWFSARYPTMLHLFHRPDLVALLRSEALGDFVREEYQRTGQCPEVGAVERESMRRFGHPLCEAGPTACIEYFVLNEPSDECVLLHRRGMDDFYPYLVLRDRWDENGLPRSRP